MIIQAHSPENRRTPRHHSDDLNAIHGIANAFLFGAVIFGLIAFGYVIISTALAKPENPVRIVADKFMAAIGGDVR